MPFVLGHAELHIGDDVTFNGKVDIISGRFLDHPKFSVGNRSMIGGNTLITVNSEVTLEDDVIVSTDCRISDSDGHPRDALLRAQKAPLNPRDIRPVRICRYAWIGNGSHITKGVTIGEGAIISANSVVISDIPPYCLAMGNPAEIYFRNIGRSKTNPEDAPQTQNGRADAHQPTP
jgi:acetyltransferase-like isoleucine patch superfamily enzyme